MQHIMHCRTAELHVQMVLQEAERARQIHYFVLLIFGQNEAGKKSLLVGRQLALATRHAWR